MKTARNIKLKAIAIEIICYLHIFLFCYAAISKILDFQNFQVQLGQSPLLSTFALYVSYGVIISEITISILLAIPRTRQVTLYLSFYLMVLFTAYIFIILNYSSFVPCSCGGILEKLGWTEHLIFNLLFVAMSTTAILMYSASKRVVLKLVVGTIASIGILVLLFLSSENTMHKENPFIRRFPQGTAARVAKTDLKNTHFYIAGATEHSVYLADRKAPLQVYEYDTNLQTKKHYVIQLDTEDFPFKALQLQIVYPHFFLYDKTVPVIYKGLIADWKAKVISQRQYTFSDIIFTSDNTAIFRGQVPSTRVNTLAHITNQDTATVYTNNALLQKQIDGIFDTDGTMQYSYEMKKFIYTYYYRNQYIMTDDELNIVGRGKTIDTVSHAQIKVAKIVKSGDSKMAAPPLLVNNMTTITHNLLMVNSMLRGKFEDEKVWKNASVIDVYDTTNQNYLLSFYVFDESGFRMKNCYATSEALYILSGHYLLKYGYGERIKSKIKK